MIPRHTDLRLVVVLVASACAADAGRDSAALVRDSVGIRIVENLEPAWVPGEEWRLGPEPILDIGRAEGEPEYQLFRAASALRLADGRIVIANAGTHELRFYDAAGRHLTTSGRKGGGPGEFEGLLWVSRFRGDSLLAYDWRQRRLSVFDDQGRFARSVTLRAPDGRRISGVVGPFDDGTFVVQVQAPDDEEVVAGVVRPAATLFRCGTDGEFGDSLASYRDVEGFQHALAGGGAMWMGRFFGRSTELFVQGDRLYVAPTDAYEILLYSPVGVLQSVVRKRHEHLPVTDADIKSQWDRMLERYESDPNARATVVGVLNAMPMHRTMPAFSSVLVDDVGNIWVLEYSRPGDTTRRWTVFDSGGRLLGSLQPPRRFRILHLGDDFVLGKWWDELDVEHVQLYELIKP
ncbi:MAG: hypothetical protein GTN78_22450 [Gemmatimonadales bacterium]|nr:hypothetical protein [Gemmatimonadales bacterium]NIR02928.1 hypothetical protein [Gemmatimonadales bacterium]